MEELIKEVYSLVDKISQNEQKIVGEDVCIEIMNREIVSLSNDNSCSLVIRLKKIEKIKYKREKARKNIDRLIGKNEDLYEELEILAQYVKDLDVINQTVDALNYGKQYFEGVVKELSSQPNATTDEALIIEIKEREAARDTFDFAMGICKGISHTFEVVKKYPGNKDAN